MGFADPLREAPYLPDADCIMKPATELYFNDASWLEGPEGMTLVHKQLSHATCEALFVTSLKNNHQTRGTQSITAIACPAAGRLREELAQVC